MHPVIWVAGAVAGVYEIVKYATSVSEIQEIQTPVAMSAPPMPETGLADSTSHFTWLWVMILALLVLFLAGVGVFSWVLAGQYHAEKEGGDTAPLAGTDASSPQQSVRDTTSSRDDQLQKDNSELKSVFTLPTLMLETILANSIAFTFDFAAKSICSVWLRGANAYLSYSPWLWEILPLLGLFLAGVGVFSWVLVRQHHAEKESGNTASLVGTDASSPQQSVRDTTSSSDDQLKKENSELKAKLESTTEKLAEAEAQLAPIKAKLDVAVCNEKNVLKDRDAARDQRSQEPVCKQDGESGSDATSLSQDDSNSDGVNDSTDASLDELPSKPKRFHRSSRNHNRARKKAASELDANSTPPDSTGSTASQIPSTLPTAAPSGAPPGPPENPFAVPSGLAGRFRKHTTK